MKRFEREAGRSALLLLVLLAVLGLGIRLAADDEEDPGVYIVDVSDWICGLGDPRQLTHPARVEYDRLMDATPEMQELRREGIDPDSARGVILRTRAQAEVKRACTVVRQRLGHCSMWKEIRRRDGKPIPDRTLETLKEVGRFEGAAPGTDAG